jgi:hypothetical protein
MSTSAQKWCAWGGIALAVTFVVGWAGIGGFVPPPSPNKNAAEITEFFASHQTRTQLGLFLCLVGSGIYAFFTGAISVQLKRIEGQHSPLHYTQMIAGAGVACGFTMGLMIWYTCSYRPELDPIMTLRLNDMAWFIWVGWAYLPAAQTIAVGIAILRDRRPDPVFPRWLGYCSLWCALLYLPGGLAVFFRSGPLAWNGLITWWFLVIAYFIWVVAITYGLIWKAIPHQEREEAAASAQSAAAATNPVATPVTTAMGT